MAFLLVFVPSLSKRGSLLVWLECCTHGSYDSCVAPPDSLALHSSQNLRAGPFLPETDFRFPSVGLWETDVSVQGLGGWGRGEQLSPIILLGWGDSASAEEKSLAIQMMICAVLKQPQRSRRNAATLLCVYRVILL